MVRVPRIPLFAAAIVGVACAAARGSVETPGAVVSIGLDAALGSRLDSILESAIVDRATPGAAIAIGRAGSVALLRGYGRTDYAHEGSTEVAPDTYYDLASLTKVIATTTVAMILEETGRLDLDRSVASYLPGFNAPDKSGITVRQLLLHRGGLEAFAPLFNTFRGRDAYLQQINARPLASQPGTRTVYSDWDMILLQLIMERITGRTLDVLANEMVFAPLGMKDTGYKPAPALLPRIAATEVDTMRGGLVRGFVHDENAWAMGGVAGHAGLFSTARDLAVFARMMLNGGEFNGVRIVKRETLDRWTARQGSESSRALGWDTPSNGSSAGRFFTPGSYGHTGFTGTSIWLDPVRDLFVILLTNRVNPTRANNKHVPLRRAVADAAQESILGMPLVNWESGRR
jgi:CubicO group peptidase (beta-lactamase class C family)